MTGSGQASRVSIFRFCTLPLFSTTMRAAAFRALSALGVVALFGPPTAAQLPSTTPGTAYMRNFDRLPAGGPVPSTNNSTIADRSPARTGTGTTVMTGSRNAGTGAALFQGADLSVTKVDTPDPVTAGTSLTYTITVTNAGPGNALSVSLTDPLPGGTTFVSIASPGGWTCSTPAVGAGGTVSCVNALVAAGSGLFTLVVTVDPATAAGTVLSNTATVSSESTDPNPGNDSGTATTTVATSADLSVTKVDTPDPVVAGTNLSYNIKVTNAGPSNAAGVTLADTLPAGTTFLSLASPGGWSCSTPAIGAAGTVSCSKGSLTVSGPVFTLRVAVAPSLTAGTILSNTVTTSSATADPNPGNESATATTTVLSPATLTGTKTVSGSFTSGGSITYTIVLRNGGPATQGDNPGHELTDVLPAALHLVSASATSGIAVATTATRTVTWDGSLPSGASVTITIQAVIDPTNGPGTTISNQGTISYDADGNGTNEASTVTDDPSQPGAADPTSFVVTAGPAGIPTVDGAGLLALAALLACAGLLVARR